MKTFTSLLSAEHEFGATCWPFRGDAEGQALTLSLQGDAREPELFQLKFPFAGQATRTKVVLPTASGKIIVSMQCWELIQKALGGAGPGSQKLRLHYTGTGITSQYAVQVLNGQEQIGDAALTIQEMTKPEQQLKTALLNAAQLFAEKMGSYDVVFRKMKSMLTELECQLTPMAKKSFPSGKHLMHLPLFTATQVKDPLAAVRRLQTEESQASNQTCRCDIKNLMSTGHDSGCPEKKR